jgi:hypothetical protein
MKFIHEKVRLNASITQAMRFFLIGREIEKWFGQPIAVENKLGGRYAIEFTHSEKTWVSDTSILEKDFEKKLKFDMMTSDGSSSYVEVYFMPCTSETEYCTEIHIMHKLCEDDLMKSFWKDKLNQLRVLTNGDWVIEDRDLVLSTLKGGL